MKGAVDREKKKLLIGEQRKNDREQRKNSWLERTRPLFR
jgi:hypothetical protein